MREHLKLSVLCHLIAELAKRAGLLHAHYRKTKPTFALSDGLVLATALAHKKKIITNDADFC